MSTGAHPPSRSDTPPDWLDRLLAREAADHAGDYIADRGFTARVMQTLPAADALPAWRRPVIVALWLPKLPPLPWRLAVEVAVVVAFAIASAAGSAS